MNLSQNNENLSEYNSMSVVCHWYECDYQSFLSTIFHVLVQVQEVHESVWKEIQIIILLTQNENITIENNYFIPFPVDACETPFVRYVDGKIGEFWGLWIINYMIEWE